MIWRTCFIIVLSSICLGASCASGLCAGTNDQEVSLSALTMGDNLGTNQLVVAELQDTNNYKLDSGRILSPNDMITVVVYQEDDLDITTTIDKNGMVMLPLLGQVKVGGMTIGQATERIQRLYNKDYLVNPQVNLTMASFAERRFAVLGQIGKLIGGHRDCRRIHPLGSAVQSGCAPHRKRIPQNLSFRCRRNVKRFEESAV